jgi:hypothetical protein
MARRRGARMFKSGGLVAGLFALSIATSANATIWIQSDSGGRIEDYLSRYQSARESKERVVIDGSCLSACTLVLGIVPRDRICVTERATLGFHAAWEPDDTGRAVQSAKWTRVVWQTLPGSIRHWISQRGGLRSQMLFLRGRELASLYPACSQRALADT